MDPLSNCGKHIWYSSSCETDSSATSLSTHIYNFFYVISRWHPLFLFRGDCGNWKLHWQYFIQPRDIKIRNLAFQLFIRNFGFLSPILRNYILLNGACRSYALSPVYEAATRSIEEGTQANTIKAESDENDSKEVILPGVNLLFDGAELHPFDIGACLQARQPISLIAEAAAASASLAIK